MNLSFWIATPPLGAREDDGEKRPPVVFARSFAPKQSSLFFLGLLDCRGLFAASQRRLSACRLSPCARHI